MLAGSVSLRIQSECGKILTRKTSVFGHISRVSVFEENVMSVGILLDISNTHKLDIYNIYLTASIVSFPIFDLFSRNVAFNKPFLKFSGSLH